MIVSPLKCRAGFAAKFSLSPLEYSTAGGKLQALEPESRCPSANLFVLYAVFFGVGRKNAWEKLINMEEIRKQIPRLSMKNVKYFLSVLAAGASG